MNSENLPEKPNEKAVDDAPDTPKADYVVGYKKPPKHTQFPYGNGPGKGKPKGAKNAKTLFTQVFGTKITAKINGETKKISKMELIMHQLANDASKGNPKAIALSIALLERYGPSEPETLTSTKDDALDLIALKDFLSYQLPEQGPAQEQGDNEDG